MCYAGHDQTSNFVEHNKYGFFGIRLNANGLVVQAADTLEVPEDEALHWTIHGVWLGVAWLAMGYALLATKRYAKALWKCSHYLHAIIGYMVFWITVIQSAISIKKMEGIDADLHNIIGVVVFAIVPIVTFSGSATAIVGKPWFKTPEWKTHHEEKISTIGRFHRRFGYFSLFVGVLGTSSGIASW